MRRFVTSMVLLLAVTAEAEVGRNSEPAGYVSREQVSAAIQSALARGGLRNLMIRKDDVTMDRIPARTETPEVFVIRITVDPRRGAIDALLRCTRRECLPFYATVTEIRGTEWYGNRSLVLGSDSRSSQGRMRVVRAGDRAVLKLIGPGISISVPVRCLQSGGVGDSIRVRDTKTGRVFVGNIRSAGVLQSPGRLQ